MCPDLLMTDKDDLIEIVSLDYYSYIAIKILQVWRYLATIRNNVKATALILVTTYPEMTPPPGLTAEQQIQYTKNKVAALAGEDIQFTGDDYDSLVSTVNNNI